MLFRPVGTSKLHRIQGAFVTEDEIARICGHWAKQGEPEFDEELLEAQEPEIEEGADGEFSPDEDDLLADAARIVVESETASVSMIQRRLRVGYTRAGRLIDMLERRGIISGYEGSKPRQVLVSIADLPRILGSRRRRCPAPPSRRRTPSSSPSPSLSALRRRSLPCSACLRSKDEQMIRALTYRRGRRAAVTRSRIACRRRSPRQPPRSSRRRFFGIAPQTELTEADYAQIEPGNCGRCGCDSVGGRRPRRPRRGVRLELPGQDHQRRRRARARGPADALDDAGVGRRGPRRRHLRPLLPLRAPVEPARDAWSRSSPLQWPLRPGRAVLAGVRLPPSIQSTSGRSGTNRTPAFYLPKPSPRICAKLVSAPRRDRSIDPGAEVILGGMAELAACRA